MNSIYQVLFVNLHLECRNYEQKFVKEQIFKGNMAKKGIEQSKPIG